MTHGKLQLFTSLMRGQHRKHPHGVGVGSGSRDQEQKDCSRAKPKWP